MATSVRLNRETIDVVNTATGARTVLFRTTPVVTETMMDGSTHAFEKLATITDRYGGHVNRVGDREFATLDGIRFKLCGE